MYNIQPPAHTPKEPPLKKLNGLLNNAAGLLAEPVEINGQETCLLNLMAGDAPKAQKIYDDPSAPQKQVDVTSHEMKVPAGKKTIDIKGK